MNVDRILETLNNEHVDYLLIGGMNFLLRHFPELTFDVDIWVQDSSKNLDDLNRALRDLGAEWGLREQDWKPVEPSSDRLTRQAVFCLTTRFGALDVFRKVAGLECGFEVCKERYYSAHTAVGVPYLGLSDEDMLRCQMAIPLGLRKQRRIQILEAALSRRRSGL